MADLIDRAALFADINEDVVFSGRIGTNAEMRGANKIVGRIKAAKAVDAVEVVRCKDCKHRHIDKDFVSGKYCSKRWANGGRFCEDEDFCSYGERKET